MNASWIRLALCGSLAVSPTFSPTQAQPATPKPTPAKTSELEKVAEGELRLDGRLTGILGQSDWSLNAFSFTSPRGLTKEFDEPRSKAVRLSAATVIHPVGETVRVGAREVKVGTPIAVIGKSAPDGTLIAREIILLEGYGQRKTVGTLSINPMSSALIDQSRKLRDAGQMVKALEFAQRAADGARAIGDRTGEALSMRDVTLLYLDTKQWDKAFAASSIVEKIGRETGTPLATVTGLSGKANALQGQGKNDEAIPILAEALGGSTNLSAQLRYSLARSYVFALVSGGQIAVALPQIQNLAALETELGKPDEALQSRMTIALLEAKEKPAEARAAVEEGQKALDNLRQENERGGILAMQGLLRWRLGDKDTARADFESSAKAYEASGIAAGTRKMRQVAAFLERSPDETKSYVSAIFNSDLAEAPAQTPENGAQE